MSEEGIIRINPAELVNAQMLFSAQVKYNYLELGVNDYNFHEMLNDNQFSFPTGTNEIGDIRDFRWEQESPDTNYHMYLGYDSVLISVDARSIHLDPSDPIQSFSIGLIGILEKIEELKQYFVRDICSQGEPEIKSGTLIVSWQSLDSHHITPNQKKEILESVVNHIQISCSNEVYGYRTETRVMGRGTCQDEKYEDAIVCEDIAVYPFLESVSVFAKRIAVLRLSLLDCNYENQRIYKDQKVLKERITKSSKVDSDTYTEFIELKRRIGELKDLVPKIHLELRERERWKVYAVEHHRDRGLVKIDGRKRFPVTTIYNLGLSIDLMLILDQLFFGTFIVDDLHDLDTAIETLRITERTKKRRIELAGYIFILIIGILYVFTQISDERNIIDYVGIFADYLQILTLFVLIYLLGYSRQSIE